MRKALASFVVVSSLLVASHASAAARGVTGALAIQIATLSPIILPGAFIVIVNGSGGGGHVNSLALPGGTFATTGFVLPVTDPGAAPIKGVQVTVANAAGSFSGSPLGGTMPLVGATKVCLFGGCSAAVANLTVPLGVVGAGGFAQVTAAVNLTVIGAPWTTGTVAIGTITAMGSATPASNTSGASGILSFVTPVFVSTNIAGSAIVPVFGILVVDFLPEPSTLVLLGSGVAGLAAYGRSRARS